MEKIIKGGFHSVVRWKKIPLCFKDECIKGWLYSLKIFHLRMNILKPVFLIVLCNIWEKSICTRPEDLKLRLIFCSEVHKISQNMFCYLCYWILFRYFVIFIFSTITIMWILLYFTFRISRDSQILKPCTLQYTWQLGTIYNLRDNLTQFERTVGKMQLGISMSNQPIKILF